MRKSRLVVGLARGVFLMGPLRAPTPQPESVCHVPLSVRFSVCYPGHTKAAAPRDCP